MANTGNSDKWYFTKEQLESTPSRKCGYDSHKELSYRQQAANFIQDMGQRLKVSQLCINTAIVYMHRFYVFHSFTHFPWHQMAAAALFLAAKVEEQPRKLEYVIKVSNMCRNSRDSSIDINSDRYISQSQDLVFNENVLLQTLGFDVAIDHPHTHVVRCCHLVRASKDLAQTSYFMASNSLHLTTMCIQYRPTVVACFCILVACKWSNWEIPLSNEKKEWYSYVDPTVTAELLQQLTEEFLVIFEACPSRLKEKIMAIADVSHTPTVAIINSPFDTEPRKKEDPKDQLPNRAIIGPDRPSRPHDSAGQQLQQQHQRDRQKDRLAAHQQKTAMGGQPKPAHAHHRPPVDPKLKQHQRATAPVSPFPQASRSDKDTMKREHAFKHNVPPDGGSNNHPDSRLGFSADKQRIDMNNRSRGGDAGKGPLGKQDAIMRRHEPDSVKKHLSASGHDRRPPSGPTSHKLDQSKSVPKQNVTPVSSKSVHSSDSGYGSFVNTDRIKTEIKTEPIDTSYASYVNTNKMKFDPDLHVKAEIPTPAVIKRPSLFSPEKTPPRTIDARDNGSDGGALLSPLTSPVEGRRRTSSTNSESELRPVMKKIDQVEGFENLMRDSTIGINKYQTPDHKEEGEVGEVKQEFMGNLVESNNGTMSRSSSIINGLETNPTIISNLLKEASAVPHLSAVVVPDSSQPALLPEQSQTDSKSSGHHHKSKKKNKEKHRHKDKDKNREEKERKKKNKYKDREKHKPKGESEPTMVMEPLKLKITMEKPSQGLKIKIPKNKINTENISELSSQPSIGIKLKISKEVLNNCPNLDGGSARKRERDLSATPEAAPPHKTAKTKANGKHSSSKVVHTGSDSSPADCRNIQKSSV